MEHAKILLDKRFKFSIRIKNALLYVCYGYFADLKICDFIFGLKENKMVICCLLPGWFLYEYWKYRYE